jgi:hypothetical protein
MARVAAGRRPKGLGPSASAPLPPPGTSHPTLADVVFLIASAGYEQQADECLQLNRATWADDRILEGGAAAVPRLLHGRTRRTRLMAAAAAGDACRAARLLAAGAEPDAQMMSTWVDLDEEEEGEGGGGDDDDDDDTYAERRRRRWGAEHPCDAFVGCTPLHFAAHAGATAVVEALLAAGATPCVAGPRGLSAGHVAARQGHAAALRLLLTADPSAVGARAEDRDTPLHLAAAEGHTDVVSICIAGGARLNAVGANASTPLARACAARAGAAAAAALVAAGADIRAAGGAAALLRAASRWSKADAAAPAARAAIAAAAGPAG